MMNYFNKNVDERNFFEFIRKFATGHLKSIVKHYDLKWNADKIVNSKSLNKSKKRRLDGGVASLGIMTHFLLFGADFDE